MKILAQRAYEAYAATTGGKTYSGGDMPGWDALPPLIQLAWANAVVEGKNPPLEVGNAYAWVLNEVGAERLRQDAKWGPQNHAPLFWLAILGEEFGEVSKEVVEAASANQKYAAQASQDPDENAWLATQRRAADKLWLGSARAELVQLAAVAVAMIESLDRNELRGEVARP